MVGEPYLKRQLIAYIGNKRSLLPFLGSLFLRLHEERSVERFLDPFAGSGAVARLGKRLGFSVHANDWEYYAYILNHAFVALDRTRADTLFAADGGIEAVIAELNSQRLRVEGLNDGIPADVAYISRHYAPERTAQADYRRERLFYSRENALFVDAVRHEIDLRYPENPSSAERRDQRALLIALLLYEAATHANTSGVFKAYHKGFGGHGGDALGRILAPMQLEVPCLIDGQRSCSASATDAADCAQASSYDLVYLDPPYNQHQYGSNYFMLNTIARWDRPDVDGRRHSDGTLRSKAGIRPDWKATRSGYCSRAGAPRELERLFDAIDAPRIVLSYNAQGIIPLESVMEICARHGRVEVAGTGYVRYRGGRQSLTRKTVNHEFALVVYRGQGRAAGTDAERFLLRRRISELIGHAFVPRRLGQVAAVEPLPPSPSAPYSAELFDAEADGLQQQPRNGSVARFLLPGGPVWLEFDALRRLTDQRSAELDQLSSVELARLLQLLETAACADNGEEVQQLLGLLGEGGLVQRHHRAAVRRLLVCLRKLAHRKYRDRFEALCRQALDLAGADSNRLSELRQGIEELQLLAAKRFNG